MQVSSNIGKCNYIKIHVHVMCHIVSSNDTSNMTFLDRAIQTSIRFNFSIQEDFEHLNSDCKKTLRDI